MAMIHSAAAVASVADRLSRTSSLLRKPSSRMPPKIVTAACR